jgi:lipid-binding SYLF domain-containing protein
MDRREFLSTAAISVATIFSATACGTVSTASATPESTSATRRRKLDADADASLSRLYSTTAGSRGLVAKSRGVLIFPAVVAAGLGVGGEYGEGVLRVGNRGEDYYNLASVSVGLQIGAQSKAIIFLFMTADSLSKFRSSQGWSVGADASVAVLRAGANGEVDLNTVSGPVMAFVMTNAGLMVNLTLEGTKITRLQS